jgi:hypothetical protein
LELTLECASEARERALKLLFKGVYGRTGMVSLDFVAKRCNISVGSVQKETASLLKRDCRARAAHPSAVDYIVVKQLAFVK